MKTLLIAFLYFFFSSICIAQFESEKISTAVSFFDEFEYTGQAPINADNRDLIAINHTILDELGGAIPMDILYIESQSKYYVYGKRRLIVIDATDNTVTKSIEISTHSQYHPNIMVHPEPLNSHANHLLLVEGVNNEEYVYCATESLELIIINVLDDTFETTIETPDNLAREHFYSNIKLKYDERTNRVYWAIIMGNNGSSILIYNATNFNLIERINIDDGKMIDIAINQELDEFYVSVTKDIRIYNANTFINNETIETNDQRGDFLYINNSNYHKLYCFARDWQPDNNDVYQIDFNENSEVSSFESPFPNESACFYNSNTDEIYIGFRLSNFSQNDIVVLDPEDNSFLGSLKTTTYSDNFHNFPLWFSSFNNKVILCKQNEIILIDEENYTFELLDNETAEYNVFLKSAVSEDYALVISPWGGNIVIINLSNTIDDKLEVGAALYFGCFNSDKGKAYFYSKEEQEEGKVYIYNSLTDDFTYVDMGNRISDMFVYSPDENTNRVYVSFFDETNLIKAIDGDSDMITNYDEWINLQEFYCASMFFAPNNKLYCMLGMDNEGNNDAGIEILDGGDNFSHLAFHAYTSMDGALAGEFCYNPNSDMVYAIARDINAFGFFGKLTVIDGYSNITIDDFSINNKPHKVVSSLKTGKVYISHLGSILSIYTPATGVSTIDIGYSVWDFDYDPIYDLIYVLYDASSYSTNIGFIDNENFIEGIELPYSTCSINYNPEDFSIYAYVPHNYSSEISEENEVWRCTLEYYDNEDDYSFVTTQIPLGNWHTTKPTAILYNNDILFDDNLNQIYVANGGHSNISVITYDEYKYLSPKYTWLSIPRHLRTTTPELTTPTETVFAQENISQGYEGLKLEYNFIDENDNAGVENIEEANYTSTGWSYDDPTMSEINSTRGYVLTLTPDDERLLKLSGLVENPNTEIDLYCKKENWIGYFLPEEHNVFDALADIVPDIYSIKHQYFNCWLHNVTIPNICAEKASRDVSPGTWVCDRSPININYGDMIKVIPFEDISGFQWNWSGNPSSGGIRPPIEYYAYEEKASYETFVIILDTTETNPIEIGAFVNDTCIGATTVIETDTVVVLSAYLGEQPGDSVVLEKYYGGQKQSNSRIKTYRVKNNANGIYENRVIKTGEKQDAFIINFNNNKEVINQTLNNSDFKVFPNPATDELNFSFDTDKDCNVKISIYDINGRLISVLVNQNYEEGLSSGTVNLENINGRKLEAGIYFVNMIIGDKIINEKLIIQ